MAAPSPHSGFGVCPEDAGGPTGAVPASSRFMAGHTLPEWLVCWLVGADGLFKIQPRLPRPAAFISCLGARRLQSGTHPSPPAPSPAGVLLPPCTMDADGITTDRRKPAVEFCFIFHQGENKKFSFLS